MTGPARRRGAPLRAGLPGGALRVLGFLALLVALDWAVGAAWGAIDSADPPAVDASAAPLVTVDEATRPDGRSRPTDPRVDTPAMADAPWRFDYYDALAQIRYDYVPGLYNQAGTFRSAHINTDGGVRRSYEPVDSGAPRPDLWLFGGSAMWGEGQRDDHTIPSELARLAEADGWPVHVTNLGERAWVIWQDALRFERHLAHHAAPAFAVFYDGANEFGIQPEHPSSQPSLAAFDFWEEVIGDRTVEPGLPRAPADGGVGMLAALGDLADSYRSTSAVGRVVGGATSLLGALVTPAGAERAPASTPEAPSRDDVEAVYRRGRSLAEELGRAAGVETRFYWQPMGAPPEGYPQTAEALEPGTRDLTRLFEDEGRPIFTDAIHTNELGAALVARALWDDLRPAVRRWYAEHDA